MKDTVEECPPKETPIENLEFNRDASSSQSPLNNHNNLLNNEPRTDHAISPIKNLVIDQEIPLPNNIKPNANIQDPNLLRESPSNRIASHIDSSFESEVIFIYCRNPKNCLKLNRKS